MKSKYISQDKLIDIRPLNEDNRMMRILCFLRVVNQLMVGESTYGRACVDWRVLAIPSETINRSSSTLTRSCGSCYCLFMMSMAPVIGELVMVVEDLSIYFISVLSLVSSVHTRLWAVCLFGTCGFCFCLFAGVAVGSTPRFNFEQCIFIDCPLPGATS